MEGVGGDSTCGFPSMLMMVNNSTTGTGSSSSNRRIFLNSTSPFMTSTTNSSGDGIGGHASMVKQLYSQNPDLCFMESNNTTSVDHVSGNSTHGQSMKAKIMAHPHFPRLLAAYANCQKVGAPPEVVARLDEACAASGAAVSNNRSSSSSSSIGEDPALDQFMEAYCEMLLKYEQELTKPFEEAMLFLSRIEYQFKALTLSSDHHSGYGDFPGRNGSSEEDIELKEAHIDPQAEDRELKGQLLRRYSGYIGNLKQEFLKKRKKGKLPKEARQQLVEWWTRHYKWPYPSESQKLALAESTGLDQKQINNWFINQRKRHWKPSEEMQFVVMDGAYPHYYYENVAGNPLLMDVAPNHFQ